MNKMEKGDDRIFKIMNAIHDKLKPQGKKSWFIIEPGKEQRPSIECMDELHIQDPIESIKLCFRNRVCIACQEKTVEIVNLPCKCKLLCRGCASFLLGIANLFRGNCCCLVCFAKITHLKLKEDEGLLDVSRYIKDLKRYNLYCLAKKRCFNCSARAFEISNLPCGDMTLCNECFCWFLREGYSYCVFCADHISSFQYQGKTFTLDRYAAADDVDANKLVSDLALPLENPRKVLAAYFDPSRRNSCLNCKTAVADFQNMPCECNLWCEKCNGLFYSRVDAHRKPTRCCKSTIPKACCKAIRNCKCLVCGADVEHTKRVETFQKNQNNLLDYVVQKKQRKRK